MFHIILLFRMIFFFYFLGFPYFVAFSLEKEERKESSIEAEVIAEKKHYTLQIFSTAVSGNPRDSIDIVSTVSVLAASKDRSFSNSTHLLAQARGDYERILSAFYSRGFFGGSISIKMNGKEVSSISPNTQFLKNVAIVICVSLGRIYRFSKVNITDLSLHDSILEKKQKLLNDIGYVRGHIAESDIVFKAEALALESWKRQGYPRVKIINRAVIVDHATQSVNVDIQVDEGQKAVLGKVLIRNISRVPHMNALYVARMTGLSPGDFYHPDDLKKANKRLARLDVFSAITIREADNLKRNRYLPLELVLEEYALHRIGAGVALSTLEGAGLEAYWLHRNLFGKAERLRFDTRIGNLGSKGNPLDNFGSYDYRTSVNYIKPGIFAVDTDFIASLEEERVVLSHYASRGVYLHSGFSHNFMESLLGSLYANASQVRVSENDSKYNRFTMYGFLGGMLYDTRDQKTDARRGKYSEFVVEPFYEVEHGSFSVSITAEGRGYFSLDNKDRFVLASRIKIGSLLGSDKIMLPANKLFFAGGSSSVRGYASHDIGLITEEKKIIGGRSLLEGSAEIRTMLTDYIGVTAFIDTGIVGKNFFFNFCENQKIGLGLGLRYATDIGPIRFDIAKPLNGKKRSGLGLVFYIGIGQAF